MKDWTCKWASVSPNVHSISVQDGNGSGSGSGPGAGETVLNPPLGFVRDCRLAEAGFGLLGAVLGLEVIMGAVAVLGLWVTFVVRRERMGGLFGSGRGEVEKESVAAKA